MKKFVPVPLDDNCPRCLTTTSPNRVEDMPKDPKDPAQVVDGIKAHYECAKCNHVWFTAWEKITAFKKSGLFSN